ncbi:hypothetical protein SAMN05444359_1295 [Neolewinella agarilytica]|uniref:Secretory lipase n=2 Tax=Neolewinella agarilytica TaxID=478744 RepID=A0A1H9MH47_9BACT|nr:hypothetical protein SAMN05444359_1295 [Neolewinella agarilytica]
MQKTIIKDKPKISFLTFTLMKRIIALLFLSMSLTLTAQEIVRVQQQANTQAFILNLVSPIQVEYDVLNYKVVYTTTDAFGQLDTASGLLSIPDNNDFIFPMAVYNHGTVGERDAVPSAPGVNERFLPQGLAASGFITLSPDYLGLGESDGIHPYVHAATEASAGRDMLLAVRSWLEEQEIPQNGQLFLTGYSQGGHATQALHRDLQRNPGQDELTVTAATHLSGPYSISEVMLSTLFAEGQATLPGYIAYTYIAYNSIYGLFNDLGDAFVEPYLTPIRQFSAEELSLAQFNAELERLLGENNAMLGNIFQDSILQVLADRDTSSAIIQALIDNDTYDWAPEAPTVIFYCTEDEQVPFRNSILADSVMRANGSTSVLLETGGPQNHGGCVVPAVTRTIELFKSLVDVQAVSLGEVADRRDILLSPNPVNAGGELRLRGMANANHDYVLYDASGRALFRGQTSPDGSLSLPESTPRGWLVLRVGLPDGQSLVRRLLVR